MGKPKESPKFFRCHKFGSLPDLRGNIHSRRPPPSSEFDIAEGGRDKTLSLCLSSPDMQMGMGPNQTASNRLFVCVYPDANERRWEKKVQRGSQGRGEGETQIECGDRSAERETPSRSPFSWGKMLMRLYGERERKHVRRV